MRRRGFQDWRNDIVRFPRTLVVSFDHQTKHSLRAKVLEQRYQQVLKILETLQDGDGTMVEDRDTNLSREQQPRINLARIVYNQSKIYLLDDPLAGLDAHVGDFVFKECIKCHNSIL
jgi:ABC-type transport system involved in cytochrome bd biosynthesis fused ATPase/permease subunit